MTDNKDKVNKKENKEKVEKGHPETDVPSYSTFPIANAHTIDIDTRVTIPSEEDLEEGRDWVNENQK